MEFFYLRMSGIKYYNQRYRLFSKFDEGIELDEQAWYSVTPEVIAEHIANRVTQQLSVSPLIVDGFCGAGGNTIQFALALNKHHSSPFLIGIDIDAKKIKLAKKNAKVYGVDHLIEFIVGDYFKLSPKLKPDCVFLSPPWGGPDYLNMEVYNIQHIQPLGGKELVHFTFTNVCKNVILCLPRNINPYHIVELTKKYDQVEVEYNSINGKLKTITCYFHNLVDPSSQLQDVYSEEDIIW